MNSLLKPDKQSEKHQNGSILNNSFAFGVWKATAILSLSKPGQSANVYSGRMSLSFVSIDIQDVNALAR